MNSVTIPKKLITGGQRLLRRLDADDSPPDHDLVQRHHDWKFLAAHYLEELVPKQSTHSVHVRNIRRSKFNVEEIDYVLGTIKSMSKLFEKDKSAADKTNTERKSSKLVGGKWKIGDQLGEGGQAKVYKCTNTTESFGKVFALKKLPSGKSKKEKQSYRRFYREIETIRKIDHPNIIRIVDRSDDDSAEHYYVMEYFEDAKPLKKLLYTDNNPYFGNALQSLDLFRQLAGVILECAKNDIVHRDLSPGNVLILNDGSIKVIDFGISKVPDDTGMTSTGENLGTVNYRAPECEFGSKGKITSGADLYSAGKVVWAAITNHSVFARETPCHGDESLTKRFPDNPETWHLHHIFDQTIRKEPKDRFSSVDEAISVCETIERLIKGNFQPIEKLFDMTNESQAKTCPACGLPQLSEMVNQKVPARDLRHLEKLRRDNLKYYECQYCGFIHLVNMSIGEKSIEDRSKME